MVEASGSARDSEWPNAVSLVMAGGSPRQRDWAVATAIAVTRKLAAAHSKVIMADLAIEQPSEVSRELGVQLGAGMVDVLFRDASFSSVARRPENESFFFLPLGVDPPPPPVLFQHPRWRKIAARLAEADAHLLPCVLADDWLESGPIPGFEACIVLNGTGIEIELPGGARRLAEFIAPAEIRDDAAPEVTPAATDAKPDAVRAAELPAEPEPPAEPAGVSEASEADTVEARRPGPERHEPERSAAAPSPGTGATSPEAMTDDLDADESSDEVGEDAVVASVAARSASSLERAEASPVPSFSRRRGPDRRGLLIAGALVTIGVVAVGLWRILGNDAGGQPLEAPAPAEVRESSVPTADAGGEAEPPSAATGTETESASVEAASGGASESVALPFSVAIASYSSFEDARERRRRWSRDGIPYYVAPTVVRGVVYYRVFAGLLPNREAAEALMSELVRAGVKDTVRAWDVRPTRLAFSFGTYPNERDAEAAAETLSGKGVPAYVVAVPGAGPDAIAYHVYAGGYENPDDARPLRDRIAAAGLDVELVERVGLESR